MIESKSKRTNHYYAVEHLSVFWVNFVVRSWRRRHFTYLHFWTIFHLWAWIRFAAWILNYWYMWKCCCCNILAYRLYQVCMQTIIQNIVYITVMFSAKARLQQHWLIPRLTYTTQSFFFLTSTHWLFLITTAQLWLTNSQCMLNRTGNTVSGYT